jgi:hypothetical protein
MKKLAFAFAVLGITASFADAAPSYLTRDGQGGYRVTYDYKDKPKSNWYMSLRAELNFLSWKNKYSFTDAGDTFFDEDKYSMKPIFGGNFAIGKKFGYNWRGEVELGYTGGFSDKDSGAEFSLSAPYALVNGMYDFSNGIYLGAGVGAAMPIVTMDYSDGVTSFVPGDRSKMSVSPMAGLMLGFSHKLDDNFVFDLRYRIAGFNGATIKRELEGGGLDGETYETKVGLVLDNSFSIGIRYEF